MDDEERRDSFVGDSFRAYTAAKVMASLVFVQMNVSPWNLNVGKTITRLFCAPSRQGAGEKECFSFPISCVFACLDCLCKVEGGSHLMARLYSIVTLIFTNMSAMVQLEGLSPAKEHLNNVTLSSVTPILIRCFKIHIESAGGSEDVLFLRLLLCAIRAINSFSAICSQRGASGVAGSAESTGNELVAGGDNS